MKLKTIFYCSLFLINISFSQNNLQKADDTGRIIINTYLEENQIIKSAQKIFINKLNQIVTKNGIGGNKSYPRFILTGNIDEIFKEVTSSAPPMYVLTLNINLYIGDAIEGRIFSSESFELKTVGRSYQKAYISAISKIKPKKEEIQNLMINGKNKIIEYYNSQCDFIIKEAIKEASTQNFNSAIYRLTEIPKVCKDCFNRSMDQAIVVFKQKLEFECEKSIANANSEIALKNWKKAASSLSNITPDLNCYLKASTLLNKIENNSCSESLAKAKGAFASRKYSLAGEYLGQVSSESSCHESASDLYNELIKKTDELDKREFELVYEKYNRSQLLKENQGFELEKRRIDAIREIGASYGENQPREKVKIIVPKASY